MKRTCHVTANALLKTLGKSRLRMKFLLATTDP